MTVHPNAIVVTIRISIADLIGGGWQHRHFPRAANTLAPPLQTRSVLQDCIRATSTLLVRVSSSSATATCWQNRTATLPVHRAPRQTQTMPAYAPCAHQQSTLVSDDRQRPIRLNRSRCLVYVSKKQCISCGCILAPHWRECHLCRVADNTV